MKLIVCICTWNRAPLLRQTLSCLAKLDCDSHYEWEVLIVNNNCSDNTDDVVKEFSDRLKITYVHEATPGKSHALNRAVSVSVCDWIVFTDDDVLIGSDWLNIYAQAAQSANSNVAFLGGGVEPWFVESPPYSMAAALPSVRDGFCGVKVPEKLVIDLETSVLPVGANCAFRFSDLINRKFDVRLGPNGRLHITAEEWQMMREILLSGKIGQWIDGAGLRHYVSPSRFELGSLFRFYFGLGCAATYVEGVPQGRKIAGVPIWMVRKLFVKSIFLPFKFFWGDKSFFYADYASVAGLYGRIWQSRIESKDF